MIAGISFSVFLVEYSLQDEAKRINNTEYRIVVMDMKKILKTLLFILSFVVDLYAFVNLYKTIFIGEYPNDILIPVLFVISAMTISVLLLSLENERRKMLALQQLSYNGRVITVRMILCYYSIKYNAQLIGEHTRKQNNESLVKRAVLRISVGEEKQQCLSDIIYNHTFDFYLPPYIFNMFLTHDVGKIEEPIECSIAGTLDYIPAEPLLAPRIGVNRRNLNLSYFKYYMPRGRIFKRDNRSLNIRFALNKAFDYDEEEAFVIFPPNFGIYVREIVIVFSCKENENAQVSIREYNYTEVNASDMVSKCHVEHKTSEVYGVNEWVATIKPVSMRTVYLLTVKMNKVSK